MAPPTYKPWLRSYKPWLRHGNFVVIFSHYKHIVLNKTIFFHYQLLQEDVEGPVGP